MKDILKLVIGAGASIGAGIVTTKAASLFIPGDAGKVMKLAMNAGSYFLGAAAGEVAAKQAETQIDQAFELKNQVVNIIKAKGLK